MAQHEPVIQGKTGDVPRSVKEGRACGSNEVLPQQQEKDQAMTKQTATQAPREIVFHAYPRLIFAWPIILLGFLLYPLDAWVVVRPDILAWLWGSTLFVVILTLGVHVNRNLSLFWAVLGSAAWLLGIYLRDGRGPPPFSALSQLGAALTPPYPRHAALA